MEVSPSHIVDNLILPINYPPGNQHIPYQGMFEDDFLFPKVGYVSSLQKKTSPMHFQDLYILLVDLEDLATQVSFRKFQYQGLVEFNNLILAAWHWLKKRAGPYTKN